MRHIRNDNDAFEQQFHGLVGDLQATRFPTSKYPPGMLEDWLLAQYDRACERHDMLDGLHLDGRNSVGADDYSRLWANIVEDAFDTCKSITAKKAIWGACASATLLHNNAMLVKQTAPILYERTRFMPKGAKEKRIDIFAGVYAPNDFRLTTLVAASQRMQMGDASANSHIRQWLQAISMAPGVLPIRKHSAAPSTADKEQLRTNHVLWWDVVVPFCKKNPDDKLLSDKIFFYLPVNPGKEAAQHLVQSLSIPHQQQWAYANILFAGQTPQDAKEFWEQAFSKSIAHTTQDCRLYLALFQMRTDDAKELARKIDAPLIAMLESLDSYSIKTMAEMLYARWLDKTEETPELPQDWFDETSLGF